MRTLDRTLSSSEDGPLAPGRRVPHLYVVMHARQLEVLPSRHALCELDEVIIGRGSTQRSDRSTESDGRRLSLICADKWMSRPHARLRVGLSRCTVEDHGSRNGIRVNGESVASAVLSDGDVFEVGKTLFLFREAVTLAEDAPLDTSGAPEGALIPTMIPELARELDQLAAVAGSRAPILVLGPSGTGKELVSRAVHEKSARSGKLVAVNCGAITASVMEAELFGYKRGAFSGATEDRTGLIEEADGGTLFLDEVGDLPPSAQVALLRTLQEGEVRPVGATSTRTVDIRVVAATNRDLESMVRSGDFRGDLLGRLSGMSITLPPLHARREDFGLVTAALLRQLSDSDPAAGFDGAAAYALLAHEWPFNIRGLEHALEVALALAGSERIALEHLPPALTNRPADKSPDEQLRERIVQLLGQHAGNVTQVAAAMGKQRQQIQRWCKRLAIDPAEYRA